MFEYRYVWILFQRWDNGLILLLLSEEEKRHGISLRC